MNERQKLEQAIAAQEGLRATLGDAVVDVTIAALQEKLATLPFVPKMPAQRPDMTTLVAVVTGDKVGYAGTHPITLGLWNQLKKTIVDLQGYIVSHMGDTLTAVWGAQDVHEKHAEQAIQAALHMQDVLAELREEMGVDWQIRIGIDTGAVNLEDMHLEDQYQIRGDAIDVAYQLVQVAPVRGILISHHTYGYVRGLFDVSPQYPIHLKGMVESLAVYVVERKRPQAFRIRTRKVAGIETKMMGRESELRYLQNALYAVVNDRQLSFVTIVGETGIGKSRLVYEFDNWLELAPTLVRFFRGRCYQNWQGIPYTLIRDLFCFRFQIHDNDTMSEARHKLETGMVALLGQNGVEQAHFVGHLIGIDFPDSPYTSSLLHDPKQIQERACFYVTQFFAAATAQNPVVIILEDIHWADRHSLDLIKAIAEHCVQLPFFILAAAHPTLYDWRPQWEKSPAQHTRLELKPLSLPASQQLVADMLQRVTNLTPVFSEEIVSLTKGSPLFIEELVLYLIDWEVITIEDQTWTLHPDQWVQTLMPITFAQLVETKFEKLSPNEKIVLQQASVSGSPFWREALLAMTTDEMEIDVSQTLTTLLEKEIIFLHDNPIYTGLTEFSVKVKALQRTAYQSLSADTKKAYHAKMAAWLQKHLLCGKQLLASMLAEHYRQVGDMAQASHWLGIAGNLAQATYANQTAVDYYRAALEMPDTEPALQTPLYKGLGQVLRIQGLHEEALAIYQQMQAVASTIDDHHGQAQALLGMALIHARQGKHQQAFEGTTEAEELLWSDLTNANVELLVHILCRKGWACFRLGHVEAAFDIGQEALALARQLGDKQEIARSLNLIGGAQMMQGHHAQCDQTYEEALKLYLEEGNQARAAIILSNMGENARLQGDGTLAVVLYADAMDIVRKIGDLDQELVTLNNLSGAQAKMGDTKTAIQGLLDLIERAPDNWFGLSESYRFLAEAYLTQDEPKKALPAAQQAYTAGKNAGNVEHVAYAWHILGRVASGLEQPIPLPDEEQAYDAVTCFQKSLAAFQKSKMKRSQALVLWSWARHELTHGDVTQGTNMWYEAHKLFKELNLSIYKQRMDAEKGTLPLEH